MIRRPVRRLALVTCAVLAAAGLSSCATFSDNDVVARVGDEQLTSDEVETLFRTINEYQASQDREAIAPGDTTVVTVAQDADGDQMRSFIGNWIVHEAAAQLLEAEELALTDDDLTAQRTQMLDGVDPETLPPAEIVDYLVWQGAVEAKFGLRTEDAAAETALDEYVAAADVYVDPYYGVWNSTSLTVDVHGAAG